jgi:thiosulfate/3-mercaptopyruvate sulfurtransferase
LRALLHEVLSLPAGTALVDVRSPAEFNGEVIAPPGMTETAQRAGHIPGAASIPWAQAANEDGTFKSAAELRQLYSSKGITPDKAVVTYCRIGERSSHTWFVLKELLGFSNVKNYDGSWTEYGSVVGVPIDNPAKAREPAAV